MTGIYTCQGTNQVTLVQVPFQPLAFPGQKFVNP